MSRSAIFLFLFLFLFLTLASAAPLRAQVEGDDLAVLVRQLGDDRFEVRSGAEDRLQELGRIDPAAVLEAFDRASGDPEVQGRVARIRREIDRRRLLETMVTEGWRLLATGPVDPAVRAAVPDERLIPWVQLVHEAPSLLGSSFDPRPLVRAANELRLLGKEGALEVLREYERLCLAAAGPFDDQKILLLVRVLFEPLPGRAFPLPELGVPNLQLPPGAPGWPLFPLALVDDVPFLVVTGYFGCIARPADAAQLAWCEENATVRNRPLEPGSPIAAADRLLASDPWSGLRCGGGPPAEVHRETVRGQALRALASIRRLEEGADGDWARVSQSLEGLRPRWDPARQDFVASRDRE